MRKLGNTDLLLSTIGLGTWAMGGAGWAFSWGAQDDQESTKAIYAALDAGVNWIDTAPAYGLGHAEEVVGKALKGLRDRPLIATKCGRSWDASGRLFPTLKKDVVRREVEASLQRLQVETLDLYQIHWPQPEDEVEEAWEVVGEMIQEGKIRCAGVCNFSETSLRRLHAIRPVASLQPPYSLIERGAEDGLLDFCAKNGIGVVAYSPMQKGLLTGQFSVARMRQLSQDDHRHRDPQFQEPLLSANLNFVEGLREIAGRNEKSLAQLAIAWVLRRPEVTSAIVGARGPVQIGETAGAAAWALPEAELREIEKLIVTRENTVQAASTSSKPHPGT